VECARKLFQLRQTNLIDHVGELGVCVFECHELPHERLLSSILAQLDANSLGTIAQSHLRQRDVALLLSQLLLELRDVPGQIVNLKFVETQQL
jgi:hypothetical protein